MALTQRKSILSANVEVNARAALFNGGWLDIYSGVQPATPEMKPNGTLLASLRFSQQAFAAGENGAAIAAPLAPEADAPATGVATWYRITKADHKTAVEDGSVGTTNANLIMANCNIQQHAEVVLSGFVIGVART